MSTFADGRWQKAKVSGGFAGQEGEREQPLLTEQRIEGTRRATLILEKIGSEWKILRSFDHLMIARHLLTAVNKAGIFCFARLN